jgi:two-component system sensor histidine kinase KdpD
MSDQRPDPDMLLLRTKERERGKGLLKIFLGMSAGVGKTYAMLREAQLLRARGEDVAAGWIEPHGRPETEALAAGLEALPPRIVEYRGVRLRELDLEAALARRPAVLLVDELAHSNAPALKHPKRYQDVAELLESGVSVYTTVNVQHMESLADLAEEIADVRIGERVPDSFFDGADEIQLVDIPPEELIERLKEGKVYTADRSREAIERFFRIENLALLRELALRQAAQLAGRRAEGVVSGEKRPLAADLRQRILVAVSPSPNSEFLIRSARRLAAGLRSEWTCIHVETGARRTEREKSLLTSHLTLARNLGAAIMILPGQDVAATVLDYARANHISILVVGKSGLAARRPFQRRSLSARFLEESGRISVIAVQEKPLREPLRKRIERRLDASVVRQYLLAAAAVAAVTGCNALLAPFTGYWSAAILYLAAISFLGFAVERPPLIAAAAVSALLWNFLFIPPVFTFAINKSEDVFGFVFYFILAVTSSWMTSRTRRNERMLSSRERRLRLQRELAEKLEGTNGVEATAAAGAEYVQRAFGAETAVYVKKQNEAALAERPVNAERRVVERELAAAKYCFARGTATGRFTENLPLVDWHYVPLAAPGGTIGVVGVRLEPNRAWTEGDESYLLALSSTISLAVQREILYARNRENLRIQESERLSRILLNSVSHELKTPLTLIKGGASELLERGGGGDDSSRAELARQILAGADRLQFLVEDLLSMSRLESGAVRLHVAPADPADVVSLALKQAGKELGERNVKLELPSSTPPVPCDLVLVIQVLANLLRNAAEYAGPAANIAVRAETAGAEMTFAVADDGPGVAEDELPRLFDKFFRGKSVKREGTGLGLSICKGIVEAHGGSIAARNRPEGGLEVRFSLPLERQAPGRGAGGERA